MSYIDTNKVRIPKGFFDDLNVPKLLDWLNSQPAADVVEVVHGEWNEKRVPIGVNEGVVSFVTENICSICGGGYVSEFVSDSLISCPKFLYCPNCGAKMDGDKNGEINKDDLKIRVTFTPCKDCDRVAVVRCKDCKHFKSNERVSDKFGCGRCVRNSSFEPLELSTVMELDFCSYGERRCEK